MRKLNLLFLFSFFVFGLLAQGGDDRLKELNDGIKKAEGPGWIRGGGIGFDLSGLGIANPRIGAGANRFGIGGIGTFFADRKYDKASWENTASLQLGIFRQGSNELPFTKNMDVLRLTSKFGRSITSNNKWFLSAMAIAQTSIIKTYTGNFLNDNNGNNDLFSQFFAPAQIQFHPGIEWKPDNHFNILFSPVGLSSIFVLNDELAALNVHGNELGKNSRVQLVPSVQIGYKNKFFNDRVAYTSSLNWTTNYLDRPFAISALNFWQNNLSFQIFKGLSLDLFGEAAYDHYKPVQQDSDGNGIYQLGEINPITVDGEIPTTEGPDHLIFGTQFTGSFMLKYNKIF